MLVISFREDERKKQRRDSSSSSSSYTSASSSTYTEDSDNDQRGTEQKTPEPLTPTTPTLRKDDFFDQKPAGRDYSSVIDSLSTTTEQDNKHDFDNEKPKIYSKQPSNKGPTLKTPESTDDSRQVYGTESSDTEEPLRPKTSIGHRKQPNTQDSTLFLDGFKVQCLFLQWFTVKRIGFVVRLWWKDMNYQRSLWL